MNSSSVPANLDDIQATLTRLYVLVETSHFQDEQTRSAMLEQLDELNREVLQHSHLDFPDSLHEALRQAESLAVNSLVNPDENHSESDITDLKWSDVGSSMEDALRAWEAKHPKLVSAFMDFTSVLSKLGI